MLKMAASLLLILGGAGIGYARSRETHRKRKEPGDFASDSSFSERRDPMRQQFSSRRIPGDCSKNQWIFWDNPYGMPHRKWKTPEAKIWKRSWNFVYKEIFIREIPEGRRGKKKWRFFGALGRRLGYLDREMQIKQIELLETDVEEQRRQLREKMPEQKKICQSLGIMGGILLAVLFW